ncbi:ImmA/IrrE family metallo-endopeptidase [Trueperella pyogenes]|uniref:ImmA/IrrE family metallo-endopeptidase n=1 Tax=Trueperella pyogenes TaxID=1661 RepID=UPI0032553DF4
MVHYIYHHTELDEIGERIREAFTGGSSHLQSAGLDGESFVELFLGATIDYADLCHHNETLGLTTLSEGPVRLVDRASGSSYMRHYSTGTVVLNNDHVENDIEARQRFTLFHEGSHVLLHSWLLTGEVSRALEILVDADKDFDARKKCTDRDAIEEERWHEIQANRLAAAILMPKSGVILLAQEYEQVDSRSLEKALYPDLESKIADVFYVSRTAARHRLDSLGIS